ncbi:hypothetical protein AHAS_Ahas12G0194900 [Arachis hypogaea]
MMSELKFFLIEVPMIYCDNFSAVLLAVNPISHSKSKYFKIYLYFFRNHVNNKEIGINHIPKIVQVADIFTKVIHS